MKKRKIFIGLALASACVFSLAACGKKAEESTTAPTVVDTSKTPAASSTAQNAQSSSVVTSTPTSTQQGEGQQQGGEGEGQQQGGEGQQGGEQVVTKYSINYDVNGHGTAPANKTDVTEITTADLAAISTPGYRFDGWFTDQELTTAAVAESIDSDATLYAKWTAASFDAVLAKGNNSFVERFESSRDIREYSYADSFMDTNIYFLSAPNKDKPNSPKSNYSCKIENGKLNLIDVEQTDSKGSAKGIVNFGDTTDSAILEGYVDVTIPKKKSSWTIFQLYGTDTAKTSDGEIFGLRTVEETVDKTKKVFINYRVDGGDPSSTGIINSFEITDNTTFGIHMVINQVTGKITIDLVKENGEVLPFIKDLEIPGYVLSTRYLFTSVDNGTETLSFTNVLLRGEGTIDDADQYRAKVLAYYNPFLAEFSKRYTTNADQFTTAKNALISAVEAATTKEAINALIDTSSQQTASPEMLAIMNVKSDQAIAIELVLETYPATSYTIYIEDYSAAMKALSHAYVKSDIDAALALFAAIPTDAQAKDEYIATKVSEFKNYFPASNYTFDGTDYNNKTDYDNLVASITGNDRKTIDENFIAAISGASSILTDAQLLAKAKTDYIKNIGEYSTDLTGKEISSSEQTDIDAYYASTEETSAYNTRKASATTAINAAETLDAIKSAYSTFTSGVDSDINGIVMPIGDYKADRKKQINETDAPKYKANQADDIADMIDLCAALYCNYIDSATTKDVVKEEYETCIAQFNLILYKDGKRTEFRTWINNNYGLGASNEIKTHDTTILKNFSDAQEDAEQAILSTSLSTEAQVDAAFESGQTAYETCYQELLAYEFTIDFENVELSNEKVVYGNALDEPSKPTEAADKIFVGWYADSEFETEFDFTSLIYDDTTVYAKFVDAVTVTLNYNATIGEVTQKNLKIEKNTGVSAEELNVAQESAVLVGWYSNSDFSGDAITSNTTFNSNIELYAKWNDVLKKTNTVIINEVLTTVGERPGYVDADTHPNTVVSNEIITYKFNADLTKDVIMDNGTTKGLAFNDASKTDETRYIKIVLSSKGKIKFGVSNNTDNLGYVSIGSSPATATKDDKGVVTVPKSSKNKGITAYESDVLSAGTYYINWSRKQILFNYITVEKYVEVVETISSITATVTAGTDSISISDVKLLDDSETPNVIKTLGTDEYTVEVKDSEEHIISNYSSGLAAGRYTVTITYKNGDYTVYNRKISVGIEKHTVSINGTAYEVEDGSTLESILPPSATKADNTAYAYTIKYEFDKWVNEVTNDEVTAETVVTGNLIVSPLFVEKYYVSSKDDFKTVADFAEEPDELIRIYLDSNIELDTLIHLSGNIEINTGEYELTGSNKIMLYASASVVCDKDIEGLLTPYEIDNHEISKTGEGPYTYTVVAKSNS